MGKETKMCWDSFSTKDSFYDVKYAEDSHVPKFLFNVMHVFHNSVYQYLDYVDKTTHTNKQIDTKYICTSFQNIKTRKVVNHNSRLLLLELERSSLFYGF